MFRAPSLLASLRYAIEGFTYCVRTQRNMRIHLGVGIAAFCLAAWLRVPALNLALVASVSSLVVIMEMLNTALEATVDLTCPEPHPLAKIAKDVAAAAVLISAANAVVVGLLVMGPALWARLGPLVAAFGHP